jgi:hypothetical protein
LWNYARSFTLVALGPFPWHFKTKAQSTALLETVPWWVLAALVGKGVFEQFRRNRRSPSFLLVLFALAVFAVFAFYFNNFGIIMRIRVPAVLALLPFIFLAFHPEASRRTSRFETIIMKTKLILIKVLPKPPLFLYRSLSNRKDLGIVISFLILKPPNISFLQRFYIIKQLYLTSYFVDCAHTQYEMLSFIKEILSIPQDREGCIVEAGSYKGGSTAKFSLAAKLVNRKLIVFDSFEGIPAHTEYSDKFPKGSYCGTMEEVKDNVKKFGAIEICEFVKGYFE